MFRFKNLKFFFVFCGLIFFLTSFAISIQNTNKKVLFVGIDGVGYSILQKALCISSLQNNFPKWIYNEAANWYGFGGLENWVHQCGSNLSSHYQRINDLNIFPTFQAGYPGTKTRATTLSAPGWTTNLTGTWINKHGISDNFTKNQSKTSSFLSFIHQNYPNSNISIYYNWEFLFQTIFKNEVSQFSDIKYFNEKNDWDERISDLEITYKTMENLKYNKDVDVMFTYLTDADEWSHLHFDSTTDNFISVVRESLDNIENILGALEERKHKFPDENWLVILTTDHGRGFAGYHGDGTLNEKLTFIGVNQPVDEEYIQGQEKNRAKIYNDLHTLDGYNFENYLYHYEDTTHVSFPIGGLFSYASQVDIAPTILNFLDIETDQAGFVFDGRSFLKLRIKNRSR